MLIGDLFEDEWEERPRTKPELNQAYKAAIYSGHTEDEQAAWQLLKTHYSRIVIALNKFQSGDRIYRGVSLTNPAVLVDPSKAVRTAANTSNYANMLVSNILPSWKGWPRRDQSLICSTNRRTAEGYGHYKAGGPHVVLPFDDATIGVCSAMDFWDSFGAIYPPTMNDMIERLVHYYLKRQAASTPQGLVKDFADLDQLFNANPGLKTELVDDWGEEYKEVMAAPSFLQGLNQALEPNKNGFRKVPLSKFDAAGSDRECWVTGPAILAQEEVILNWLEQLTSIEL